MDSSNFYVLLIEVRLLMAVFKFSELPACVSSKGSFHDSCEVYIGDDTLDALLSKKLTLAILQHGKKSLISNARLSLEMISGVVKIYLGNDDAHVSFKGLVKGQYELRLWKKSRVSIGFGTTSNGARIVCNNSEFVSGDDCMFSSDVLIQTADQHGIVDVESGKIINDTFKSVVIEDHVWLGRNCTLTPNANVGAGSVIGTGSIVTGSIPSKVVAAGVPARVISSGRTWSRSPCKLDVWSANNVQQES